MKKIKPKLIIFDFDGTIADSEEVCFRAINKALRDNGQIEVTKEEKRMAENLPAREVFRYFKVPNYRIPFVVKTILSEMVKNFSKVEIFIGIKSILKIFKKSEFKIVLLTSNFKASVEKFIKKEGLEDIFDEVYFRSGIFSKHVFINKIVKKNNIKPKEVLMIGDEVRDIEAAKESKIKIAVVTWGYNKKSVLKRNNPDYIVEKPKEILEIIKLKNK